MTMRVLNSTEIAFFINKKWVCPNCCIIGTQGDRLAIKIHECVCDFCNIKYIAHCKCGYSDTLLGFQEIKNDK